MSQVYLSQSSRETSPVLQRLSLRRYVSSVLRWLGSWTGREPAQMSTVSTQIGIETLGEPIVAECRPQWAGDAQ
eukprot:1292236-Prymnesium_polylepis.1